jgi:hypothetical protein
MPAPVERILNTLNVFRGIIGGTVLVVFAVFAFSTGGWTGWVIGACLLGAAVYAFIWPFRWPKYRPPDR